MLRLQRNEQCETWYKMPKGLKMAYPSTIKTYKIFEQEEALADTCITP